MYDCMYIMHRVIHTYVTTKQQIILAIIQYIDHKYYGTCYYMARACPAHYVHHYIV